MKKKYESSFARLALVTALLMLLSMLAPIGGTSEAQEPDKVDEEEQPDAPAPGLFDKPSAAELEDIASVAAEHNLSMEKAVSQISWNDNFALLVDQIRTTNPHMFTGAEIRDGIGWIGFKAGASGFAQSQVAAFGGDFGVNIRVVNNLGYSEVELNKAMETAHMAAFETRGVRDASTSHDFRTGKITTEVAIGQSVPGPWGRASSGFTTLDAGVAAVEANMNQQVKLPVGLALQIEANFGDTLSGVESNGSHHGGEIITGCTSGFGTRSISATSGTRGISTAGHCPNRASDDGAALSFRAEHEGSQGDFQWHTGAVSESDDFYAGSTSGTATEVNRRDVSAVGNPVSGQWLCRNGKTTQKHCQQVRNTNVCSAGVCNLVQMEDHLSSGGDSGGPIFWNNTAYGIHRGWMHTGWWPFRSEREVFSRTTRIDNALGVFIATS